MARAVKALGIELRYNLRTHRAELFQYSADDTIKNAPVLKWLELTDRMEGRLRDQIAESFNYQTTRGLVPMYFAKERWSMVLNAHLCSRERDPFLEWLDFRPDWGRIPAS